MSKNEVKNKLRNVLGRLTICTIPESALLPQVLKELEGRESFVDNDNEIGEAIYSGDIFEAIASEQFEINMGTGNMATDAIEQVNALAELISQNYILITKV